MDNQATTAELVEQPAILRFFAKVISYIFHPLFIPSYIFIWLMYRFPYEFSGLTGRMVLIRLLGAFWTTAFFPAFVVFLLWRLKFIQNIFLRNQKDRIIPYITTMFFYWWMWYLSRNFSQNQEQPIILKFFYMGIFLTTIFGLILNNFQKISMHAMGVAGAWTCVLLTCLTYKIHLGADLSIVTLITGIVCTSRMLIKEHSPNEVYTGLFVGIICQLIGYAVSILW
ncbi:MAG: hypothetical protein J0I41_06710 [Filimonas sp.]|nr:hypothetical protein [Filimonas sp.]